MSNYSDNEYRSDRLFWIFVIVAVLCGTAYEIAKLFAKGS